MGAGGSFVKTLDYLLLLKVVIRPASFPTPLKSDPSQSESAGMLRSVPGRFGQTDRDQTSTAA